MYVYVDSKHIVGAQNSEYLQFQWWIRHKIVQIPDFWTESPGRLNQT